MFAVFDPIRKTLGRAAALVSILLLAACEPGPIINTGGPGPSTSVQVALLVPHGAANINEQRLAADLENAARLAASDLNGVAVDLRVYPTAGQAGQAQSVAQRAVADGAEIIIGPLHAEAANAAAIAASRSGVNVLAFSNNTTIAGGNRFILGQTFENTASRLTRFAAQRGKRRILTVHSNNLAGTLGKEAIARAIASSGATSAGTVGYSFSQQGVISAVPRIKAAATSNDADAIFLTSNAAEALPLFSQLLPEAGLDPAEFQYIGLSRWDSPPQTLALPGVQGGWFALPDPGRQAQFQSRFTAAYGNTPHALAGLAYDGIAAIGALARSGGQNPFSRASLTQSAGFQGVNGVFRFNPDGTNSRGLAVATIQNRQVVIISPAPRGFGGAGF